MHLLSRAAPCIFLTAMRSFLDAIERAWSALFGGLQRGDVTSWAVVVGILVVLALLVRRSPRAY